MAGTFQMLKNNRARLQYMCKGERFSTTVEASTPRQAQKKLAQFVVQVEKGEFINTDYTLAEFAQIWFDKHVKTNCSPSCQQNYKRYLNNRIIPFLGNYKLTNINKRILQDYFNEMKNWKTKHSSSTRENLPIAKGTYVKIYKIVSSLLQSAFEWELIYSNPCRKIPLSSLKLERLPRELDNLKNSKNKKIRAYDTETYKKVISLINSSVTTDVRLLIAKTALQTGFCLEELAGLEWERDYDSIKSTLSINMVQLYIKKQGWVSKEPKAKSRARTINISADLKLLLDNFRQKNLDKKYIFFENTNFNSYTSWLKNWQIKNNISPVLTTHELRHTYATVLLNLGIDIKTVSQAMGHSNTSITLNTYVEFIPKNNKDASDKLYAILPQLPENYPN